jgi:hypothetical protein
MKKNRTISAVAIAIGVAFAGPAFAGQAPGVYIGTQKMQHVAATVNDFGAQAVHIVTPAPSHNLPAFRISGLPFRDLRLVTSAAIRRYSKAKATVNVEVSCGNIHINYSTSPMLPHPSRAQQFTSTNTALMYGKLESVCPGSDLTVSFSPVGQK